MLESIKNFLNTTGIARLLDSDGAWQTLVMFVIAAVLVYLAIVKKFEPLLLLPIAAPISSTWISSFPRKRRSMRCSRSITIRF